MTRRRAITTAILALSVALALAGPAAARLRWHACPEASGPRCTTVRVPLDRSGAFAGSVDLHVARVAFTRRRDSFLMYLSGGPGGAGVIEMVDVMIARHRRQWAAALPGDRAGRPAALDRGRGGVRAAARPAARVLHDARHGRRYG